MPRARHRLGSVPPRPRRHAPRPTVAPGLALALAAVLAGCSVGGPGPGGTPAITPGTSAAPREVNVIARDWIFQPDPIDLVPGETVLLHLVNGGLDIHEVVIGDAAVQDAWEAAEGAAANPPPGPTPVVSVPPEVAGQRVVLPSGRRVDLIYAVPAEPAEVAALVFGCHIPGHWAKGMRAAVRVAEAGEGPS